MTSLAFMFVDVPEPVWKMSSTNWSSWSPRATASAAARIASALAGWRMPRSALACAAAPLTSPSAWMKRRGKRMPEMGKLSCARCVCAP